VWTTVSNQPPQVGSKLIVRAIPFAVLAHADRLDFIERNGTRDRVVFARVLMLLHGPALPY